MTFLQPYILWGLPLLFIPVIIHLLNRLRHRPQPWGAMRFLRAANQSSISQAKLRQWLILLFRVLAVIALVFFLSRPLSGGWLGWALSPAPEVVVLVLDRSASMEAQAGNTGRSRREQALEMWSEALAAFGSASRLVLIESARGLPQEIPSASVLRDFSISGPTDTRADMPALLQRAYSYLTESRSGVAEVWIASDMQESNWSPGDPQWERIFAQFSALPQKVRFRLLSMEESGLRNVAASLVEAVHRKQGGGRKLAVTLDLEQTDPSPDPVALRWQIAGALSQTELNLSGGSLRWRNNFPLPSGDEPGWGMIELGADANAADNRLYFAFDVDHPVTALVVTANPAGAWPVQLAASDLNLPPANWAQTAAPEEFPGISLTNISLIVWDTPMVTGATPDILEQFVGSGGSLVFFPDGRGSQSFAGLGFATISTAASNAVFRIEKWNDLEGPLARTEEGFGVPLRDLEVFRRAGISGSGAVLASFADGAPFLVRKAIGKGEVYFCATSADAEWSTLADGSVLVPMLQRLLVRGMRRVNAAVMTDCTEVAGRDLSAWQPLEPGRDPRLHAGIYRVGGRFVAVNRPSEENALQKISPEVTARLFSNVPFQMHQERGGATDRLQGEVWRAFLILMLIFLVVEGLLVLPPRSTVPAERAFVPSAQPTEAPA